MLKRVLAVGAGVLLVGGGLAGAGKWRDGRIAACEQRGTRLAALEELDRRPDGFRPDAPTAGCDTDRVVAYAARQFTAVNGPGVDQLTDRVAGSVDESAVTGFYRQMLTDAAWTVSTRTPAPGENAASLCASKKTASATTYVNLSFPVGTMYEIFVADSADAGARCF
jgi:hypothetical protein